MTAASATCRQQRAKEDMAASAICKQRCATEDNDAPGCLGQHAGSGALKKSNASTMRRHGCKWLSPVPVISDTVAAVRAPLLQQIMDIRSSMPLSLTTSLAIAANPLNCSQATTCLAPARTAIMARRPVPAPMSSTTGARPSLAIKARTRAYMAAYRGGNVPFGELDCRRATFE